MKKTKAHNDQVMQWDEDTLETTLQAENELKKVKMTAKKWMKDGKVPHRPLLSNNADNSSLASTKALSPIEEISEKLMQEESKDVNEEQDKGQDSDDEASFATADTPLKQMMTMVKGMDSKWD